MCQRGDLILWLPVGDVVRVRPFEEQSTDDRLYAAGAEELKGCVNADKAVFGNFIVMLGEFDEDGREVGECRRCQEHGQDGAWAEKGRDE